MVAITGWNSMVFDEWWAGERCLDKVRSRVLETNDSQGIHLLEIFAERKRKYFSYDLRAVSHHSFNYKEGNLHLRAEAPMDQAVYDALSKGQTLPLSRESSSLTYSHHGMISAYPMDFGKKIHVDHKYAIVFWEKMKFDLVWTVLH